MSRAVGTPASSMARAGWRCRGSAGAAGWAWLALGLLFRAEIAAAVQVWHDSTAYSHCFFVLPIALYLAWDRRATLPRHCRCSRRRSPPLARSRWPPPGSPPSGSASWRAGNWSSWPVVELLFLAVLGWRLWWALSAPLLYLVFLVPFGAFLTPALQHFTAWFIDVGLTVLDIPHDVDAHLIEIPEGRFYVAEACAGLRFLIASVAFGVLYACLIYRSLWRRAAFMAASIVVPIIANGFRALGIVVLGHVLGSAEAASADHVLYGWVFFSIVILLLILAGMPFQQASAPASRGPASLSLPAVPGSRLFLAMFAVVLLTAVAPAGAGWLDRVADIPVAVAPQDFAAPAGCVPAAGGTEAGSAPRPIVVQRFSCGAVTLVATVEVFPPRSNPGITVNALRQITNEMVDEDAEVSSLPVPGGSPSSWRLVTGTTPARITATSLWIDGAPAVGGLHDRMAQARNSVAGSLYAPVLLAVALELPRPWMSAEEQRTAGDLIRRFLAAQPDLVGKVSRIATSATTL